MTTVFNEPEWEDDSSEAGRLFVHKTPGSIAVNKKKNKQNVSEWPHEVGKYVRNRPDIYNKPLENAKQPIEEPKLSKKQLKKKRKLEEQAHHKIEPQTKKQKIDVKSDVPVKKANFTDKLRENLKGSRFRFINEQLYKTDSGEAVKLFKNDVDAFQAYHDGYRIQVESWPSNPLKRIINAISKCPKTEIVADFGCGEAQLAKSVPQKVFSLDLVAVNDSIIACDMANTPLKSESVNIAVFCLSLMGTNLKDFIAEANRVLVMGGKLKIAEVESRFGSNTSVNEFIINIEKCGFQLLNKDGRA